MMIRTSYLGFAVAITLSIALSPFATSATTYYVNKSGTDSHGCTNNTTDACLTIGKGINVATAVGSVVQVGPGTYSESINLSHSGSAGNKISVQGFAVGGSCPTQATDDSYGVMYGFSTRPDPSSIITGTVTISASYVQFQCFKMSGGYIGVSASSLSNIDIWDNYLHDTADNIAIVVAEYPSSISLAPTNLTIERNYVYRYGQGFYIWCNGSCLIRDNEIDTNYLSSRNTGGDSDYMRPFGHGLDFEHNYSHDYSYNNCPNGVSQCHDDGWQMGAWCSPGPPCTPYSWAYAYDVTINGNVVFNAMDGIITEDYQSSTYGTYNYVYNWTITNNIFGYDPNAPGLYSPSGSGINANCIVTGHTGNVIIRFNTCITGQINSHSGNQTTYVQGNILANASHGNFTGCYPMTQESGARVLNEDHNLLYCTSGTVTGYGNDVVNVPPRFVNSSGRDYHLQSDSPAIGQGPAGTGVSTDFDGNTRGTQPSIGSYEYGGGTTLKPPTDLRVTVF